MKIYTRSGDKGETSLVGGKRVSKDSARVEAYGTIDELNSIIGIARAFHNSCDCTNNNHEKLEKEFHRMQNNLFKVGANLATPPEKINDKSLKIDEDEVINLENFIDDMSKDLKPLKKFILPSGGKISSFLHQARTVCRRAERRIMTLARVEEVDPVVAKYVNRLSDTLFTMARWETQNVGESEYYFE